jgi:hypothetical protein
MAVLVEQGKRIKIERVTFSAGGQFFQRPAMQAGKRLRRTAPAPGEKPRQRGLARHRLNPQHLGHRWVMRQMRHPRKFVGATKNAADKPQRRIARIIGVWARWTMRQNRPQLLAQPPLRDETRPHRQPTMRRQTLVGEANPHRLHPLFSGQIQPHRLVCRRIDGFSLCIVHTINDAKRCAFWRLRRQLHEPG